MFNSIWLYVTEACNLRCKYCFNPDEIFTHSDTIRMEDYKQILDNVLLLNRASNEKENLEITLFGGEPTLDFKLFDEIIRYSRDQVSDKIKFSVITNGLQLERYSEEMKVLIDDYQLRIQLSIDGCPGLRNDRLEGFSHDLYRRRIEGAVAFLLENTRHFSIRATLCPPYVQDLFHNFKYFSGLTITANGQSPAFVAFPEFLYYQWTEADYLALGEQVEQICGYCIEEYRRSGKVILDRYMKRAVKNILNKRMNKPVQLSASFCGFSDRLFAVSPKGKVYSCHRLYNKPNTEVGDLLRNEMNWERMEALRSIYNDRSMITPHPKLGIKECGECEMRFLCDSICPANNFDDAEGTNKIFCHYVMGRFNLIFNTYVESILFPVMDRDREFEAAILQHADIRMNQNDHSENQRHMHLQQEKRNTKNHGRNGAHLHESTVHNSG